MRKVLPAVLALLVLAVVAMELYTRTPIDVPVTAIDLDIPATAVKAVIVVHGSVDADNPQFTLLVQRLAQHVEVTGEPDAVVRYLRWSPYSDQRLRAAATAELLGARLGERLAKQDSLRELLLIVHSSGAYVADSLCESFRRGRRAAGDGSPGKGSSVRIDAVFLDPFQLRGFLDFRHGARNHGRCADFALAILNTDDPAPATNAPLAHAWNIDVTAHPGRAALDRNGHYWPPQYYLTYLPGLLSEPLVLAHQRYPRGGLVTDP